MARPKSEIPIQYHNIGLGVGDFDAMGQLFPSLGAARAIRTLINRYVKRVRASAEPLDIDISVDDIKELIHDDSSPDRPKAHSGTI